MIAVLLAIVIILSIASGIISGILEATKFSGATYLSDEDGIVVLVIKRIFTFIVLYNSMVSLSEFVHTNQIRYQYPCMSLLKLCEYVKHFSSMKT